MKGALLVTTIFIGGICGQAAAQTRSAAPRVEIGGHFGMFGLTNFGEGDATYVWGPRGTVRITDRLAVEVTADMRTESGRAGYRSFYGNYYITAKYSFREPSKAFNLFATFGAAGSFWRASWSGVSYTLQNGERLTTPSGSYSHVGGLGAVVGGIGGERPLNSHLAIRVSGEAGYGGGAALAFRLCAGLSVPIGRYRVN